MTIEELKSKLLTIAKAKEEKLNAVSKRYNQESQQILNEWAGETATFKKGDIIKSGHIIIRVDAIRGRLATFRSAPYVEYSGRALTTKLTERKDGWVTNICDDFAERGITKIK